MIGEAGVGVGGEEKQLSQAQANRCCQWLVEAGRVLSGFFFKRWE